MRPELRRFLIRVQSAEVKKNRAEVSLRQGLASQTGTESSGWLIHLSSVRQMLLLRLRINQTRQGSKGDEGWVFAQMHFYCMIFLQLTFLDSQTQITGTFISSTNHDFSSSSNLKLFIKEKSIRLISIKSVYLFWIIRKSRWRTANTVGN